MEKLKVWRKKRGFEGRECAREMWRGAVGGVEGEKRNRDL